MKTLSRFILHSVAIDLRSLAVFRIMLGICILLDLWTRLDGIETYLTDFGVLPRSVLIDSFLSEKAWSLHLANGSAFFQKILFFVSAIFAVFMCIGFQTKKATIATWILLVSLQNRNELVLQGGDVLLRLLCFWAMFLPLDRVWSVRSLINRLDSPAQTSNASYNCKSSVSNLGSLAVMVQMVLVYATSFLYKTGSEWYPDGTAVYFALQLDHLVTPFGVWLRSFEEALKYASWAVYFWEIGGPILLVLTRDWLRFATILCFIGMHLGFYLAMEIGLFSLICVTGLICFVPGVVWDKISARIECQMPHFTSFKTSWASSFSNIRNCLTRRVASPCILGKVENFSYMEWIGQALCGVSLMVVLSWVATSFEGFPFYFDERFRPFVQISRIDQRWNMFSPYPSKEDGWWVVEGKLVDGRSVDLWTDRLGSANSLKPDLASAQYSDQRHQKYMMNLWAVTYHRHRPHFANFVCRRWNRDHFGVERLQSLQLIFFKEVSVLSTQTAPLPEAITLLEQDCGV